MKKALRLKCAGLVVAFFVSLFLPAMAFAQAPDIPPAAYWGTVTIDGQPAPVGTEVVAKIDGAERGRITVEEAGKYGSPGPLRKKLAVAGTAADEGKTVVFEVGRVRANETVIFCLGEVKEVNLTVSGPPQPPRDSVPPEVEFTDPQNGQTNVPVNKTVTVTFSEDVQEGPAYGGISVKDASGDAVAVTKGVAGKVLTIKPDANLDYDATYSVVIPAGAVKDLVGNALAQEYAFSFTTQAVPDGKVEVKIPDNGVFDFTPPPSGTVVLRSNSGVELEIAPGTISGTAKITVKQVEDKRNLPAANIVGQVTEIKIENVTLAKPVTIRLPATGVTGERIKAYKLVGDKWMNLGGELKNGVVEFAVSSFSYFTVANSPAPPVAQPAPGTYTGSVQVVLNAEPGASIYYSTDGSTPSKLYTAPLTLTSSTTLKALAERNGIQSEIATFSYTVTSASTGGGGGGGGAPTPSTDKVEKPVQAGATTVAEISGKVKVEVPAGTVSGANAAIKAEVVGDEKAAGAGMPLLSKVVDVTLKNGTLTGRITITLYFDRGKLGEGQEPAVFYYDEKAGKWVRLAGTVDADKGTVAVTVDHLTMFAVFAVAREAPKPQPVRFTDMAGHWAEATVVKLAGMGVISGYEDGTFRPDNTITRAEAASILVRALKLPEASETELAFADKDAIPAWAKKSVAQAAKAGLLKGYPADGGFVFRAQNALTRAELAAIMSRAAAQKGLSQTQPAPAFKDQLPDWAKEAVALAARTGLVSGYPDGTFRPDKPVTRAEAASMVLRLLEKIE